MGEANMNILHPAMTGRRLNFASAGLSMTLAEFDAINDFEEGYRFELINGVVVVTPEPAPSHWSANDELGRLLRNYGEDHPQGSCLSGTVPEVYLLTSYAKRRADRALWIGLGRDPEPKHDTPAIVIEIVSPGREAFLRDFEKKRDEYLELGCSEYWVIDKSDRTMTVFRRSVPCHIVKENQVYSTPLLPGFELPLAKILRAADMYK